MISQRQQIIQLKDSENSLDFLKERIGLEEREHKKISIVGHSLGGYIAAEVAIGNKEMIEKLVLIDSSGMLEGPTPLLQQYLNAAMESDPILRYKKVQRVLEDLYADRSSFQWRSVFLLEQLDNKVQNMHLS